MSSGGSTEFITPPGARTGVYRPAICLVGELPPPTGGMAVQAERLGAQLRGEGHTVFHVRTNSLAQTSPWRRVKGLRGVINLAMFLVQMVRGVSHAQVVHLFSNSQLSFFLFSMPTVVWARLIGRRVVVHYHGGGADQFLDQWGWLALPILRAGHSLIVPSGFLVEVFARHQLKALAVPNTLMLEKFRYRLREPLLAKLLMARHLQPVYNVACGIRAFARVCGQIPSASLTIAGAGPQLNELELLCRDLDVFDHVDFVGNIDNERMRRQFEDAHIFLNTSRVDNQPVSILEAFASGLPVVSTSVGGIPYLVSHGKDGLLAPDDDDEAVAAHILELLRNQAFAKSLVEEAHRRVQEYSWARVYPVLIAIYSGEKVG